jgi:protein-disulfide isomerase
MRLSRRTTLVLLEAVVLASLGWMNRELLDDLRHPDDAPAAAAPVVVVDVWGDFQCAACRTFARNTLPALQDAFVTSSQAIIVWHNAPLLGPDSVRAAEAVDCANDQHQFWAFHRALFADSATASAFQPENLEQTATNLGLDSARFAACLEGGIHHIDVNNELAAAQDMSITSLPTAFVDNERVDGSPGFLEVSALVERALAVDGIITPVGSAGR